MKWIVFISLAYLASPATLIAQQASYTFNLEVPPLSIPGEGGFSGEHDESAILVRDVALGSTGGWLAGAALGAGLGYIFDRDGGESWIGPAGPWLGGFVGAAAGSAIGANFTNQQRGNRILATVASLGVGVAVMYTVGGPLGVMDHPVGAGALLVGGQVVTSTFIEIITGRQSSK